MDNVIEIRGLGKTYEIGEISVHALKGIDLIVERSEFVAIMGASGSGKSTLMNLLGCLDQPTSGEYILDGKRVSSLSKDEYADIRNQKIGFVFQGFNLLPRTTALENVELPLLYDRQRRIKDPRGAAVEALTRLGLGERLDHEPHQLSGGEQQRVAIARALIQKPSIVLADEPTGNLDTHTSVEIMSVFQELNKERITIILVTHETDIAKYARRIVELVDGRIRRDAMVEAVRNADEDLRRFKSAD